MDELAAFAEHRRLLFDVAYGMLGSVADAEDVVQESWLRWSAADRADVRDARAYLVRIASRLALNRIRANKARRETYVGSWLPEPILGAPQSAPAGPADPAEVVTDAAARHESISLAMLVVLETLTPDERAVFVLREVFGLPHDEVAAALDRTPAAVRQLAHRARSHVQARRPRFDTNRTEQLRITEQFLAACADGDLAALLALLTEDVTVLSDGGGKAKAALRPVTGRDRVARLLLGIAQGGIAGAQLSVEPVNGTPGIVAYRQGRATHVGLLDVVDGRIATVFIVANPDKLAHVPVR